MAGISATEPAGYQLLTPSVSVADVEDQFDFLIGETVNQIWFWGTIRLVFDRPSESSWYVDLQRFTLAEAACAAASIDPAGEPRDAAPALSLLWQRVAEAYAKDGVLTLRFENGAVVEAFPDDRYESWSVIGPSGVAQCLPGGEVERW